MCKLDLKIISQLTFIHYVIHNTVNQSHGRRNRGVPTPEKCGVNLRIFNIKKNKNNQLKKKPRVWHYLINYIFLFLY